MEQSQKSRTRSGRSSGITVTKAERNALIAGKRIAIAVAAVVADCAEGASASLLFAPLQPWLTLSEFNSLMSALVRRGHLRRQGDMFFPPEPALDDEPLAEAAE